VERRRACRVFCCATRGGACPGEDRCRIGSAAGASADWNLHHSGSPVEVDKCLDVHA